jgi:hypothetical protein
MTLEVYTIGAFRTCILYGVPTVGLKGGDVVDQTKGVPRRISNPIKNGCEARRTRAAARPHGGLRACTRCLRTIKVPTLAPCVLSTARSAPPAPSAPQI